MSLETIPDCLCAGLSPLRQFITYGVGRGAVMMKLTLCRQSTLRTVNDFFFGPEGDGCLKSWEVVGYHVLQLGGVRELGSSLARSAAHVFPFGALTLTWRWRLDCDEFPYRGRPPLYGALWMREAEGG